MTITARHPVNDDVPAAFVGEGDPNLCSACLADRALCGDHLERMRSDAARSAVLLAVMEADHAEARELMDRVLATEAGP